MKISINSSVLLERFGVKEGIGMIAEAGFDCIDLGLQFMLPGQVLRKGASTPFESMTDEELKAFFLPYKKAAAEYGITFGQMHAVDPPFFNIPEYDQRLSRITQKQIMLCEWLQCPYIVVHPVCLSYEDQLPPEQEPEAMRKLYEPLLPVLKDSAVTVCMENIYNGYRGKMYGGIGQEAEEAIRYMDLFNAMAGREAFGFCYDTGHALLASRRADRALRQLDGHLKALHLHDNDGQDDIHLPPMMGRLDWNGVWNALKDIRYRGTLNFEINMRPYEERFVPCVLRYIADVGKTAAKIIMAE